MKTAHRAEIFGVLIRLKEVLNPSLYAVGDVFQPFFIGLLFILSHRLLLSKCGMGTLNGVKKDTDLKELKRTHRSAFALRFIEIQTVNGFYTVIVQHECSIIGFAGFLGENALNGNFTILQQSRCHLL